MYKIFIALPEKSKNRLRTSISSNLMVCVIKEGEVPSQLFKLYRQATTGNPKVFIDKGMGLTA